MNNFKRNPTKVSECEYNAIPMVYGFGTSMHRYVSVCSVCSILTQNCGSNKETQGNTREGCESLQRKPQTNSVIISH